MLYIYRRTASESARDLAESLEVNCRKINLLTQPHFGKGLREGDRLICWGERVAPLNGVAILNGGPLSNKFEDAQKLRSENVPTIETSRSRGATNNVQPIRNRFNLEAEGLSELLEEVDLSEANLARFDQFHTRFTQALTAFNATITQLRTSLANPTPIREWIGRLNNHVGGNDLLSIPPAPDFFAVKLNLVNEYRLHSFMGKSIRAGKKVLREGWTTGETFNPRTQVAHPWVRSFDAGWRIQYDGFSSKKAMRDLAAASVKALGLDFGAVDIGELADGKLVVLEVNRAPGLEGGSITAYAEAIKGWVTGAPESSVATERRAA